MKISKILPIALFSLLAMLCLQSCYQEANAVSSKKELSKPVEDGKLTWHDIADIDYLRKKSPKPVIVDIYTDWCKWCKVMDQKTFTDPGLIDFLENDYHMVKFNAETKSSLNFKGESFDYVQNGRKGYNSLAAKLCNGRLAYPSFVVLDENLNPTQVINGFKDAKAFQSLLEQAQSNL